MWHYFDKYLSPLFRMGATLDRQQWIMLFFGVLVLGYFCMKGFGSRADY